MPYDPGAAEQIVDRTVMSYQMMVQWEQRLLRDVALIEQLGLYQDWGYESTPEYLTVLLGRGYAQMCTLVGVALMLSDLPPVRVSYENGNLTYDHLRALVYVAHPDNADDLVDKAEKMTVAQTFRLAAKIRRLTEEDSVENHSRRWLELHWDGDSMLIVSGRLPEDQGKLFEKAIDAMARTMPEDPCITEGLTPMGMKRADALCELASAALGDRPATPAVIVHVDAGTLATDEGFAEIEDGPPVSPETARRLACDATTQTFVEGPFGPLGVGRKSRKIPERVLRALKSRDGGCRFPGCRRRKTLHAHHIIHWAQGGPTDLENLVLFCPTHHYLIHEGGYKIRGRPPNLVIERPDGRSLPIGSPTLADPDRSRFQRELLRL